MLQQGLEQQELLIGPLGLLQVLIQRDSFETARSSKSIRLTLS
jgi:hypothetical protein